MNMWPASILISVLLSIAATIGIVSHEVQKSVSPEVKQQISAEVQSAMKEYVAQAQEGPIFGTTQPIAGQTYNLSGAGVSQTGTSITLASFTIPQNGYKIQDSELSDTFYITLEPGNSTKQEIVSCTTDTQNANGTATFSGCVRGLSPITPYTASSSLKFSHGGGTQVIFSNPPQFYATFAQLQNSNSFTGANVFSTSPTITTGCSGASGNSALCDKAYIDGVAVAGASNANVTTKGIVELATGLQAASSTLTDTTGAFLGLYSLNSTTTPYTNGNWIPVTRSNSKLSQVFFDFTESWAFTGGLWSSASTTIAASNLTTNALNLRGIPYAAPPALNASSTVLMHDAVGNMSWGKLQVGTVSFSTTLFSLLTPTATSSLLTVALPANTISPSQKIRISATFSGFGTNGNKCQYGINIGSGTATTTIAYGHDSGDGIPSMVTIEGKIFATTTSSGAAPMIAQSFPLLFPKAQSASGPVAPSYMLGKYIQYNFASQLFLDFNAYNFNATQCGLMEYSIETISL